LFYSQPDGYIGCCPQYREGILENINIDYKPKDELTIVREDTPDEPTIIPTNHMPILFTLDELGDVQYKLRAASDKNDCYKIQISDGMIYEITEYDFPIFLQRGYYNNSMRLVARQGLKGGSKYEHMMEDEEGHTISFIKKDGEVVFSYLIQDSLPRTIKLDDFGNIIIDVFQKTRWSDTRSNRAVS